MALRDLLVSIDFDDIDLSSLLRIDTAMDEIEDSLRDIGREIGQSARDFARMGAAGSSALGDLTSDALLAEQALQEVEDEIEDITTDSVKASIATTLMGNAFVTAGIKGIAMGVGITGALAGLVAILAPVLVLLGGLSATILAAGLGVAAFGAVAIPVMTDFLGTTQEIANLEDKIANAKTAKERIAAQKELNALYADMSDSQRGALEGLQDFKEFFGTFAKQFENPIFDAFGKSLSLAKNVLSGLGPTISAVAGVVNDLLDEMNTGVVGGGLKSFFEWMETHAAGALYNLAHIIGNTIGGLFNMIAAFSPIGASIEGGLLSMTERFNAWASNLGSSNGFQKFIEYAKTNGPALLGVLGNLFGIIGKVIGALAPIGTVVLAGLEMLTGFINANLSPVFEQLGTWVSQLAGVFMNTLVPAMMPIVQQLLPIAAQWFQNLMNLGKALVETFMAMFPTIKDIVMTVIPIVITVFENLYGIIGALINNVVIPLLPKIATIISEVWSVIKPILEPLKNLLKMIGTTVIFLVSEVIGPMIPKIADYISGMWSIVKPILNAIVSVFGKIIDAVTSTIGAVKNLVSAMTNFKVPKWVGELGGKIGGFVGKVVNGSHATGLERVPTDGYVAELHKDEAVLTATQSNALRAAGILSNDGGGKPVVNMDSQSGAIQNNNGGDTGGGGGTFAPQISIQLVQGEGESGDSFAQRVAAEVERQMEAFWRKMNLQQA